MKNSNQVFTLQLVEVVKASIQHQRYLSPCRIPFFFLMVSLDGVWRIVLVLEEMRSKSVSRIIWLLGCSCQSVIPTGMELEMEIITMARCVLINMARNILCLRIDLSAFAGLARLIWLIKCREPSINDWSTVKKSRNLFLARTRARELLTTVRMMATVTMNRMKLLHKPLVLMSLVLLLLLVMA